MNTTYDSNSGPVRWVQPYWKTPHLQLQGILINGMIPFPDITRQGKKTKLLIEAVPSKTGGKRQMYSKENNEVVHGMANVYS